MESASFHEVKNLLDLLPLREGDGVILLRIEDPPLPFEICRGGLIRPPEDLWREWDEGEYWEGGKK